VAGPQGPVGAAGPQGNPGSAGAAGADGKTILYGTIAPTTEGVDGDFYIDTVGHMIYGPKAGTWPAGTSLVGPTFADYRAGKVAFVNGETSVHAAFAEVPSTDYTVSLTFDGAPGASNVGTLVVTSKTVTEFTIEIIGSNGVSPVTVVGTPSIDWIVIPNQ